MSHRMKTMLRALPFLLYSGLMFAHPGHGKPGLLHFHEFSDGLLVVCVVVAAGLSWWARKK